MAPGRWAAGPEIGRLFRQRSERGNEENLGRDSGRGFVIVPGVGTTFFEIPRDWFEKHGLRPPQFYECKGRRARTRAGFCTHES